MWLNYLENMLIVLFMLSLVVFIYMVFCRDASHFRGLDKEHDHIFMHAFINRLYFVLTSLTTIGYGDIAPATLRCRIITSLVILTVFLIVVKAFDSYIDSYNQNFHQYVDPIFGKTDVSRATPAFVKPKTI